MFHHSVGFFLFFNAPSTIKIELKNFSESLNSWKWGGDQCTRLCYPFFDDQIHCCSFRSMVMFFLMPRQMIFYWDAKFFKWFTLWKFPFKLSLRSIDWLVSCLLVYDGVSFSSFFSFSLFDVFFFKFTMMLITVFYNVFNLQFTMIDFIE